MDAEDDGDGSRSEGERSGAGEGAQDEVGNPERGADDDLAGAGPETGSGDDLAENRPDPQTDGKRARERPDRSTDSDRTAGDHGARADDRDAGDEADREPGSEGGPGTDAESALEAPPETGGGTDDVPEDVRKYARFKKMDGAQYDRVNDFLRDRTYITAREWAIARLCSDFRTETGVEMTKIGENLPELVPFMTDTYTPQAVNQARASFEEKVRKSGATFLYGAMCDFFTAEELDDVMYEATEVAKFLLEVEGVDLTVDEELEAEERISSVMREVREASRELREAELTGDGESRTDDGDVSTDDGPDESVEEPADESAEEPVDESAVEPADEPDATGSVDDGEDSGEPNGGAGTEESVTTEADVKEDGVD